MSFVAVALSERPYTIETPATHPAGFAAFLRSAVPGTRSALVVADAHTERFAHDLDTGLETRVATVPAGEPSKSLAQLSRLYDVLVEMGADRQTAVVAGGGGVVGDLAGFAAATFLRGLPLVMVPTTLLAMVDSAVGGKVAVNHPLGKNLIGAFHQPHGVWVDPAFLATLPTREYQSGLAEVVKYGVALDAEFFTRLERLTGPLLVREPGAVLEVVKRSCELKAEVVADDERETTGRRAVLNYGHTFAHAYETVLGYGELLHGEAVSVGMVRAMRLAVELGRVPGELFARQSRLLAALGLPTDAPAADTEALLAAMRRDKKSLGGTLRFVLPTRLGHAELVAGVDESVVRKVLAAC